MSKLWPKYQNWSKQKTGHFLYRDCCPKIDQNVFLFHFFFHSKHLNLMHYTHFNISHTIHYQTLTLTHLIFQNPNLIHDFLNLSQNHHHSTLNATNLTSIQENQNIRHEKHQTLTFPPLKTYLFLVSFGSSPLLSLVEHLESLKEKKKLTSPLCPNLSLLSLLSPFSPFLLSSLYCTFSSLWSIKSPKIFFYFKVSKITLKPNNLISLFKVVYSFIQASHWSILMRPSHLPII